MTAAGVKAVLNFAPVQLHPKPGVKVKNVDLAISLESLSYFLARPTHRAYGGLPRFPPHRGKPEENGSSQTAS